MAASPYVIEYRGSFHLDPKPSQVWAVISRIDRFEDWWGWLREFELEGEGLRSGSVLRGVVVPPLPYRMRLEVVFDSCTRSRRIEATVHGDLRGTARLDFAPEGAGTRATVSWTIEMMQRPMRLAARVARPLLQWGHDRVVDATVEGFRRTLAAEVTRNPGAADEPGRVGDEPGAADEPGTVSDPDGQAPN